MTSEHDESCNAYGPSPTEEDQYKPTAADKARWASTWAMIQHDRQDSFQATGN